MVQVPSKHVIRGLQCFFPSSCRQRHESTDLVTAEQSLRFLFSSNPEGWPAQVPRDSDLVLPLEIE